MISETPATRAVLKSRELTDEFADLTADEIDRMSFSEYARRTSRDVKPTDTQTTQPERHPVLAEFIAKRDATENSGSPVTFEDLQGMSLVEYGRARGQLGMGLGSGEGRGILNPVAQGDLNEGVRRNAGRGALSNSNVSMPPRIGMAGRLTKDNEAPTGRNDGLRLNSN